MPLLPIDLQIMFSQLEHIGKTEAAQRQVAPEAQALQGMEMVKRNEQRDSSVNETKDSGQGPEAVKEDERRNRRRKAALKRDESKRNESKKEVFKDPDLGHHIDITG
jgi:hypothetical protein